jgi:hypothetical protein
MANDTGNMSSTIQRTLVAMIFAVLLSLMFAPHSGRGLLRFASYAHGPFFIMPSYIDGKQLVLQTIFIVRSDRKHSVAALEEG